jgi:REP element-mobilizing transposase RayT
VSLVARAWRIEYEGALYHVLSRGNERQAIFLEDEDRGRFLETLGEMAERFAVEVCAYVLMDTHYHLLLGTPRANLSRAMQWLGVAYTSRFNVTHQRSGHLFQGRFKSILVENDGYLLQLSYYIHANPLRAGMVRRLTDYRWSSYPAYAYGKKPPGWLSVERILSQLINAPDRHRAYRENTRRYAQEAERVWEDLRHGLILGTERFVESIKERFLPELPHREIPQQRQAARVPISEEELAAAAEALGLDLSAVRQSARVPRRVVWKRDLLIHLLRQAGGRTNQAIGDIFGLTYSAVSRRAALVRGRLAREKRFSQEYDRLKEKISERRSI